MNFLGRPLSISSINLNPEGWVIAQRIKFNHSGVNASHINERSTLFNNIHLTTVPLTVKIDKNLLIGQGSMRKAYSAFVKTDGRNGGLPQIKNWVAKVRCHDPYPNISLHATDARLYEACAHLLQAYQNAISKCKSVLITPVLRQKARLFEVRFL